MLLGALIWIATLVPYFVIYNDNKYRALTRYQINTEWLLKVATFSITLTF